MKIAILGFGNVGKQFAKLFSQAGHETIIGTRSVLTQQLYPSMTFKEAALVAEIVAIAIPFTACAFTRICEIPGRRRILQQERLCGWCPGARFALDW
jgi:predicted dinucleotide-binding enzyme